MSVGWNGVRTINNGIQRQYSDSEMMSDAARWNADCGRMSNDVSGKKQQGKNASMVVVLGDVLGCYRAVMVICLWLRYDKLGNQYDAGGKRFMSGRFG